MSTPDLSTPRGEWQPIETYPFGTKWAMAKHVLCCHDEKRWIRFGRYYGTNELSQWSETAGDAPTHWQPMPDLPAFPETQP